MKTRELNDLIKAWFMISLAFAVLFSGGYMLFAEFDSIGFLVVFLISGFTVGLAFLFHELMHRAIAHKYRCEAEFRAFPNMLWLALLMSFFGFIIAAPGAVMISGFLTRKQNGKISLAGPLTNIVLAILFLIILLATSPFLVNDLISLILIYGFRINSLLALFNMLPFGVFDGAKVLDWNKTIYTIFVLIALALFVIGYVI